MKKYLNARFSSGITPYFECVLGEAAQRFRDLMSRPLLLTFIQDLASSSEEPKYSFQAYRLIVEGWLGREKRKHGSTIQLEDLLRFSEDFAVCLFATGRDRVLTAELQSIAKRFHVGRSSARCASDHSSTTMPRAIGSLSIAQLWSIFS